MRRVSNEWETIGNLNEDVIVSDYENSDDDSDINFQIEEMSEEISPAPKKSRFTRTIISNPNMGSAKTGVIKPIILDNPTNIPIKQNKKSRFTRTIIENPSDTKAINPIKPINLNKSRFTRITHEKRDSNTYSVREPRETNNTQQFDQIYIDLKWTNPIYLTYKKISKNERLSTENTRKVSIKEPKRYIFKINNKYDGYFESFDKKNPDIKYTMRIFNFNDLEKNFNRLRYNNEIKFLKVMKRKTESDEVFFPLIDEYIDNNGNGVIISKYDKNFKNILYYRDLIKKIYENNPSHINYIRIMKFYEDVAKNMIYMVDTIHKNGIAHRNINLNNIFMDKNGFMKIRDFSYACENSGCTSIKNNNINLPLDILYDYRLPNDMSNFSERYTHISGAKFKLQVFNKSEKLDVWQLGLSIYQLIFSYSPNIYLNSGYEFSNFDNLKFIHYLKGYTPSYDLNELIRMMLNPDKDTRANLNEIIKFIEE